MKTVRAGRVLLLSLLLASLTLAGCVATSLLYNHADWLIARQLDGYFDLTRPQKTFVSSKLTGILSHHRHEALPLYESALRQATARVQDGVSTDDLDWAFVQYDHLRSDLFSRFVSDGTEFVRQVNDSQVSRLKRALQSRLARHEALLQEDVSKRLAKRTDRILGLVKEWLGPLSPQQEQEITRLTMNFPDTLPAWYAHQKHRHEQLLALIESRSSDQTRARLEDWLVNQDKDSDPRFAEVTKQLRRQITDLIMHLDRSATQAQRQHFFAKVDELAATIRRLQAA
jgi:Family of unknown function (DUF6279)